MQENNHKLIVFDLDGTLLDTLDDLAGSTNWALRKHGLPERTTDEIRSFVGNGTRLLIQRAVPDDMTVEEANEIFDGFTRHYNEHLNDTTKPYAGIMDTLTELREEGYLLGMLSNKPHPAVLDLAELYFQGRFDHMAGEKPGVPRKPDPTSLLNMMRDAGVTPENTIYLGDSEPDAQTVTAAGTHGIGVLWGFRSREELQKAGMKHYVSHPSEIRALSRELLNTKPLASSEQERKSTL